MIRHISTVFKLKENSIQFNKFLIKERLQGNNNPVHTSIAALWCQSAEGAKQPFASRFLTAQAQ
jgi:hypothetical protein